MTRPYSDSFKKNAVSQLLSPSSIGLQATAKKIGISAPTLLYWKKKYASISNNILRNEIIYTFSSCKDEACHIT